MVSRKKLKIWTIITHAFILVGMGHGGGFFVLLEILSFPYFTNEHFSFSFRSSFESHLPVIGLTTLLGQCGLAISFLHNSQNFKFIFQATGIILLWLSLIYFIYDAYQGNNIYFAEITCIPFVVCTIITFAGQPIKKIYNWIVDE